MKFFLSLIFLSTLISCSTVETTASRSIAEVTIDDCSIQVTKTDNQILAQISDQLKVLHKKDWRNREKEHNAAIEEIIEGADVALSSAAKGYLATNLLKDAFQNEKGSKELRNSFDDYLIWAGFHIKSFGPGTDYASMGFFDIAKTPIHWIIDKVHNDSRTPTSLELFDESSARFVLRAKKLLQIINSLNISNEDKLRMKFKIREHQSMIAGRDAGMFKATSDRLEAQASSLIQLTAAIEAKLVNKILGKIVFGKSVYGEGLINALNEGSNTIFKEQTKLALKAYASGVDSGCAWGILASKENPKIWKEALWKAGVKGSSALKFPMSHGMKAVIKITMQTIGAGMQTKAFIEGTFGTGETATKAAMKYIKVGELISSAEKENNLIKRGKLEKEARNTLHEAKMDAIDAGANLIELGFAAYDLAESFSELSETYRQFEEIVFVKNLN